MAAVYPVSIHTYTPHRDNVEYILADHVNSLQDEVTALETMVGTHPHVWTYTGDANYTKLGDLEAHKVWTNVRDRLDSLQAHVVGLERFVKPPWLKSMPPWVRYTPPKVISVRNPGQTFTPSAYVWRTYDMSVADFDSDGSFIGGNNQPCPQTGWWVIAATVWTDVPQGPAGTFHKVANRMLIGGKEVAAHNSQAEWGSGGQHRINLTYAGPWVQGELAFVQTQQYPTPSSADVWSQMQISFTYIRETV